MLLAAGLPEAKACGNDGFAPGGGGLQQIEQMAPLLKKHGLEMRSLYVNSTLHDAG
jgi:inosose dehydratase